MDEYIFISPHGTEMRARRLDERAMTGSPIEARGVPTPIESCGPWLRSDNTQACAAEILRLAEENAELRSLLLVILERVRWADAHILKRLGDIGKEP